MPLSPGPFTGRTLTELARDLRAGLTSAAELTERALDAIAERDPELNAFVTVDADGARAAARAADAELAAGTWHGPLHGVPVAVKDLIMTAGLRTTAGSRHFAEHVPDSDATCVARLRRGGAVIVGKTTTHEFAYGPTGDRSANGPSRNPHDPARMSGGSSGGSAAAVAAGLVPLALGTDTGGSVRIPAALCGVAGFKPAYGAISAAGVFPLSLSFDHVGVLAGDARDCLLAYRALADDPSGVADPVPGDVRVAWLDPAGFFAGDPRVVDVARQLAGDVPEVRLPDGLADGLRETYTVIQSCETSAVHAERLTGAPELFDAEVLERLSAAALTPGWRLVRAMNARPVLAALADALFDRHDVLALPTVPITAPPLGLRESELDGRPIAVRAALLSLTSPWNVLKLPALTVPAGTVDGLPVGLQFVCRPGDEHLLFAAAAARGA
ncbi:amidase [Nonomuraea sp. NN258]|uniref:amidase n=1 Tax=Nonomuraea antri TaxID=2730852 RepID=UPI00156A6C42|nr:amidase [Nonomuraea antri]NRQ38750.1 amidase [Nonomuraea antri]